MTPVPQFITFQVTENAQPVTINTAHIAHIEIATDSPAYPVIVRLMGGGVVTAYSSTSASDARQDSLDAYLGLVALLDAVPFTGATNTGHELRTTFREP